MTTGPSTWEEAARIAAKELRSRDFGSGYHLDCIEQNLKCIRDGSSYSDQLWGWCGSRAIAMYCDLTWFPWDVAVNHVVETVISKQHDYGHENILWGGIDGLVIRVHDKVARIRNLRGRTELNEALEDSWLDIAGYSIVAIMLTNGTFELPLEADLCVQADDDLPAPEPPLFVVEDNHGHRVFVQSSHGGAKVHVSVATAFEKDEDRHGPFLDEAGVDQLIDHLLNMREATFGAPYADPAIDWSAQILARGNPFVELHS